MPLFNIFENSKFDGDPEIENTLCITCQEGKSFQILKFNFQGSQKKHVRYATSQKEMVNFQKKYGGKIGIVIE